MWPSPPARVPRVQAGLASDHCHDCPPHPHCLLLCTAKKDEAPSFPLLPNLFMALHHCRAAPPSNHLFAISYAPYENNEYQEHRSSEVSMQTKPCPFHVFYLFLVSRACSGPFTPWALMAAVFQQREQGRLGRGSYPTHPKAGFFMSTIEILLCAIFSPACKSQSPPSLPVIRTLPPYLRNICTWTVSDDVHQDITNACVHNLGRLAA